MSSTQPSRTDPYPLCRDSAAASRLNYLYYLWKETLGYDLHPSISAPKPDSDLKIADVGCGTAIWLRSVAQALPNASLDGFDISLSQCPPVQWLPSNITLGEWDVFSEPPLELRGRYDVVHVRLLFVVVQDEDPKPIIRNLMLLLKPGGYLQWDELSVSASYILRIEDSIAVPAMEKTLEALRQKGVWVAGLTRHMEASGLEQIVHCKYDVKQELARALFDNHLAKDVEMAQTTSPSLAEREAQLEGIRKLYEESRQGAVLCTPKVVCVARKAVAVGSGPAA